MDEKYITFQVVTGLMYYGKLISEDSIFYEIENPDCKNGNIHNGIYKGRVKFYKTHVIWFYTDDM